MRLLTLTLLATLALSSCGGGKNPDLEAQNQIPDETVVGASKYTILSGEETLKQEDKTLSGDGTIMFADILSKPETANNYTVDFQLEVGGSLTVIMNAVHNKESNALERAVTFTFKRPEEADKPLQLLVTAGSDSYDATEFLEEPLPGGERLRLSIDGHNDHDPNFHFLIWKGDTLDKLLIEDLPKGRGFGARSGLTMAKAKVFDFVIGPAKDEH